MMMELKRNVVGLMMIFVIAETNWWERRKLRKIKRMGEMEVMARKWLKLGLKEGRFISIRKEGGCLVVESRDANIFRMDSGNLKRHKTGFHDIDATFYLCGVNKCEYKAKTAGDVRSHKAMVRDIDVVYYLCGVEM